MARRRSDKSHDIGDSSPGTVGDSDGTIHDQGNTPMARIHNRRHGELMTVQETRAFLSQGKETNTDANEDLDESNKKRVGARC